MISLFTATAKIMLSPNQLFSLPYAVTLFCKLLNMVDQCQAPNNVYTCRNPSQYKALLALIIIFLVRKCVDHASCSRAGMLTLTSLNGCSIYCFPSFSLVVWNEVVLNSVQFTVLGHAHFNDFNWGQKGQSTECIL